MMDQNMIVAITNVIRQSNMSDLDLITVGEVPITSRLDEKGRKIYQKHFCWTVNMMANKSHLSEAWVASNILLFTVYDGYLENKYSLQEGKSFCNHYKNLGESTQPEIMEKDCYRIMKLIRNAIQHNLSSVISNQDGLSISYTFNNTIYNLEINRMALRFLYSLVLNIIDNNIAGISKKYRTDGHYAGILNSMYNNIRRGITKISDDIKEGFLGETQKQDKYDAFYLRPVERYIVEDPEIIFEDCSNIVFKHIENNGPYDESDVRYQYSTDYVYGEYLLPQELGIITRKDSGNQQKRKVCATIMFKKSDITGYWKMPLLKNVEKLD